MAQDLRLSTGRRGFESRGDATPLPVSVESEHRSTKPVVQVRFLAGRPHVLRSAGCGHEPPKLVASVRLRAGTPSPTHARPRSSHRSRISCSPARKGERSHGTQGSLLAGIEVEAGRHPQRGERTRVRVLARARPRAVRRDGYASTRPFYAAEVDQLQKVLDLAAQVDPEIVAKTAVYCRENGLHEGRARILDRLPRRQGRRGCSRAVFPRVIDNGKMLRNFVQIIRSGVVGRKSFGSAPKRARAGVVREPARPRPSSGSPSEASRLSRTSSRWSALRRS